MKIHFIIKQCLVATLFTHIAFCSDKKVTLSPELIQLLQKEFDSIKTELHQVQNGLSTTGEKIKNLNQNVSRQRQLLRENQREINRQTSIFIKNQEQQEVSFVIDSVINTIIDQTVFKENRKRIKKTKKSIITPKVQELINQAINDSLNTSKEIVATPLRSAMQPHAQTQQQVIDALEKKEVEKKCLEANKKRLEAQQKTAFLAEISRINAIIDAKKEVKTQHQLNNNQQKSSFYDNCCIS